VRQLVLCELTELGLDCTCVVGIVMVDVGDMLVAWNHVVRRLEGPAPRARNFGVLLFKSIAELVHTV